MSNPLTDLAIAQLSDPDGPIATLDLLNGGPLDISAFAGRSAMLYFEVSDFVDGERDPLTVGNLRIEQVPVPDPLLLLGAGLGLLAVRRRLNANQPLLPEAAIILERAVDRAVRRASHCYDASIVSCALTPHG